MTEERFINLIKSECLKHGLRPNLRRNTGTDGNVREILEFSYILDIPFDKAATEGSAIYEINRSFDDLARLMAKQLGSRLSVIEFAHLIGLKVDDETGAITDCRVRWEMNPL